MKLMLEDVNTCPCAACGRAREEAAAKPTTTRPGRNPTLDDYIRPFKIRAEAAETRMEELEAVIRAAHGHVRGVPHSIACRTDNEHECSCGMWRTTKAAAGIRAEMVRLVPDAHLRPHLGLQNVRSAAQEMKEK